jgi:hypothetical protein
MDQRSKIAKLIRESRWHVTHKYDVNHDKKALDGYCQEFTLEERDLLYGPGKRSRGCFNHLLHQPIPCDKKIEMSENTLGRYCGDRSKCHHPAHQPCQWRNGDMPEVQPSLRRYRSEGLKIIQEFDTHSGSTQVNESFHVVKAKYIDKRLNFTTSTEARFPPGAISKSRSPGWPDELRESLDILPLPAECSKMLRDLESRRQRKT